MSKLKTILLSAGVLALSSCTGGTGHKSSEKYFLVGTNLKVQYWLTANSGLLAAAKQVDVSAESVGPDTYDPPAEQAAFKAAVAKQPAGILVSASEANLLNADIDAAIAKGIPVIAIDSDAPGSKALCFIGTNNFDAGRMGGRRLIKELNGKGGVILYTMPSQPNLEERVRGYKDVLESSSVKIL